VFRAPLVVGYKGEIGRFVLAGLLEHLPKANDIHCVDVNNSDQDVRERIGRADFVFLCVPIQDTERWLLEHLDALREKTVVEQTSVKGFLYQNPELAEIRFLSMHLLFRPSATPADDRRGLVFSDRMPIEEVAAFAREIEAALKTPFAILEATDDPCHVLHDRLMARQQALVHRVLLVLDEFVSEESAATFVGRRVVELAERIRSGDRVLYRMIQENPFLREELEAFRSRLQA
jgi:prephenate dehydrogenase